MSIIKQANMIPKCSNYILLISFPSTFSISEKKHIILGLGPFKLGEGGDRMSWIATTSFKIILSLLLAESGSPM